MIKMMMTVLVLAAMLVGCGQAGDSKMPFNGDVTFYEMQVTIPKDYIRDSVRSEENVWIFEHGNYERYIMLFHDALEMQGGNIEPEAYSEILKGNGADSVVTTFGEYPCVYTKSVANNGMYATEAMIYVGDTTYALTMCTTKEEDMTAYQEVYDSLSFTVSE